MPNSYEECKSWLENQAEFVAGNNKPLHSPKVLLERMLYELELPLTSASYKKLVLALPCLRCSDPVFIQLVACLINWFPFHPQTSNA